ncbi:MAG: amino acid permease [Deltaproteobacteria bacterium]|nr:amino acid permease [Deltaproteobacteria bacterium]
MERTGLARSLSMTTATAIVVGSVIGSGIFKKTAGMSEALPSPLLVLGVWVLAGAVTFLGALSAAELSAAFPESGGLYAHLRRVTGRFSGFLYGWSVLAVIQTGSIASVAYIFAQYLGYFVPLPAAPPEWEAWGATLFGTIDLYPFRELPTKCVAVGCVLVVTVLNTAGVRLGAAVQDLFLWLKVAIMAGIVAVAAFGAGSFEHVTAPALIPEGMSGMALLGALTIATSGAFWAYDGWINVTYVAGELRDPARDMPRALARGLGIVVASYVAVNLAYFWLLPVAEIRGSTLVAADALGRVLPFAAAAVSAAVIVSTFGAANAMALSSARVYWAMARDGVFFEAVGRVHPKRQTPHVALLVQGVWASALVFSGTFDQITDMLIFVSWAFYGLLALAVVVARVRFPDAPRPFKVPGYPFVPIVFVLFAAAYVVMSVIENTRNALLGTALVLLGLPVWAWFVRGRRRPPEVRG